MLVHFTCIITDKPAKKHVIVSAITQVGSKQFAT
jgi:hypothetical protein